MSLVWTNQREEIVATGEAVVIPPPKHEQLFSRKKNREDKKMALSTVNEVFEKMPRCLIPRPPQV
jgi:hypothetical protein